MRKLTNKNLLKATIEYRINTKDEVDAFHKECEKEAYENDYILSAWTETYKETKAKGEVVDEFYTVKTTYVFDNAKEPINNFNEVEFHRGANVPF